MASCNFLSCFKNFDEDFSTYEKVAEFRHFAEIGESGFVFWGRREKIYTFEDTIWSLGLRKGVCKYGAFMFPIMRHWSRRKSKFRLSYSIGPYNTNLRSSIFEYNYKTKQNGIYVKPDEDLSGEPMYVSDLINPIYGFLDEDGAFFVKFRIRIEGYTIDNIWNFDFSNPIFGARNSIVLRNDYCGYHGNKQLLSFHSPKILSLVKAQKFAEKEYPWETLLQIAHGVQTTIRTRSDIFTVIGIAQKLELFNVVLHMDRQLRLHNTDSTIDESIQLAADLNLRHYLAELLRIDVKSNRKFIKIIKKLDVEKMSGEAMMMIVAKALYGKF
ncbi:hypothetical protein B9Z55_026766 [Caenorhabditis nigoni]|uniref:Uncharacterized protein n=1 Tax=Caenorhabditis nigoni TaxID=1611254 RepID=A0A2G5SHA2_9PELO|nr:hypothetical protein B9Z55_026766 [Caenorhabditis nigoni]